MNSILREDYAVLADNLREYICHFEEKHFLVTGAAGFLGTYIRGFLDFLISEDLTPRFTADLLDNFVVGKRQPSAHGLQLQYGDVSKEVTVSRNPDYIIHAAGIASPKHYSRLPVETLESGTTGTRRVLDLARKTTCCGMLFLSSSEVYGNPDPQNVPTKESYNGNVSTSGPRACYDESKRMGETWSFLYAREFHVPVNVVRLFNVYGPGFRRSDGRVIPNFIENIAMGVPVIIHGQGKHTRTFCYIADAVEALFRVLFSDRMGEAFNIGNEGPEVSVAELASILSALAPHPVPVVHRDPELSAYLKDDPDRRCPDISKLRLLTQFRPRYSLQAGLGRTLAWHSEEYGNSENMVLTPVKQSPGHEPIRA